MPFQEVEKQLKEFNFCFSVVCKTNQRELAMADADLTQTEADRLINMDKYPLEANDHRYTFPEADGRRLEIPFTSADRKEDFILNFCRKKVILEKRNHVIRAKKTILLIRLDVDGPPHLNPDGNRLEGTHIHIYREGFGDRWAFPVPEDKFSKLSDPLTTLEDFMRYCNIRVIPFIDRDLLSCL